MQNRTPDPAPPAGAVLPEPVRELLAAIAAALDVPIPAIGQEHERAHAELLPQRAKRTAIIVQSVLRGHDATICTEQLRRWTAETPVTYPEYKRGEGGQ
jgi:hypothetical protein